jgi:hypothetical protein
MLAHYASPLFMGFTAPDISVAVTVKADKPLRWCIAYLKELGQLAIRGII